jgi:transcription elongation factor GreB
MGDPRRTTARETAGSHDVNYITPEGAKRLQAELGQLRSKERPKVVTEVADAAAQGDRSENAEYIYGKKRLREIDRRMRFLTKRLEAAVVIAPSARPEGQRDRIFFGACVVVEDEDGKETRYQIVGEDEIDLALGRVSWRSPIGRVLLKKTTGDTVTLRRPSGEVELTVVDVSYPDA